ncbi:SDR family NAD(P)-dependent oxidoreductase [Streptomyces sp. URMC 129]|uniref:SDR family NAD(P)-dependent oxidoreductase n=1 Tax=Streptomyces sp. URMC 129 TaxID=3423407 RepID=UPI003F1E445B
MAAEEAADVAGRWALVTGANRGIGFEIARGLAERGARVLATARHPDAGRAAAERLARETGGTVEAEHLDVADAASVTALAGRLAARGVTVDVLVNNAGNYPVEPLLSVDEEVMAGTLAIHVLGAWRTCRAFVPGMRRRGWGRVVNVSSGSGAISGDRVPGPGAYGVAKAGMNALTKTVAAESGGRVLVNAVCPGWVATDMGGPAAPRTPAQGADTAVWLATLPDGGPTGGFFRDREPIPW